MMYKEYVNRNFRGLMLKIVGAAVMFVSPVFALWEIVGRADNSLAFNPVLMVLFGIGAVMFLAGYLGLSTLDQYHTQVKVYNYKGRF